MKNTLLIAFLLLPVNHLLAQGDSSSGDWALRINQETGGKRNQDGLLKIQNENGVYTAYIQGGPIEINIDGKQILMVADDWTGASMPFQRYFKGNIENNQMKGSFGPEGKLNDDQQLLCEKIPLACPYPTGTWSAIKIENNSQNKNHSDEVKNLTGKWGLIERGMRRWTADLTEKAKEWNKDFNVELDLPRQRCVSSGLVNGYGSAPEIFQDEHKLTMIFSSEVRRIYLDDRKPPDYSDWYPLGFSHGKWNNGVLSVETTNLMPSVRGFMGDPISENARVLETFELDDEGILHANMTLYDPENYKTPLISSAKWRKVEDKTVVFPLLCDPDSFYRQVYEENDFDEYIERGHRRY